jgi:hypothetical protein
MEETQKKSKMKMSWGILAVLAVLLSLGAAVYFWNDAREAKQDSPDAVAAKNLAETERVVSELGEILLLNADQDPTVARVEDPTVLQKSNPDFYKDIQVGDYLVLYPQRAIVYRSSETRIINIAPIVNTEQLQQRTQDQSTQPAAEGSQN